MASEAISQASAVARPPKLPQAKPFTSSVVPQSPGKTENGTTVQSFCLSTPRHSGLNATQPQPVTIIADAATRHYIGSPKASSILSAFLDFGGSNVDEFDLAGEDESPCAVDGLLDFDAALAVLEAKALPRSSNCGQDPNLVEEESSTNCGGSDGTYSDAGAEEEGDEEFYESDFEDESDEESDDSDGEQESTPQCETAPKAAAFSLGSASRRARSRAGSRSARVVSQTRGDWPTSRGISRSASRAGSRPRSTCAKA